MNRRKETGLVMLLGIALMFAIAMMALCSCTTKQKVVTEYVTVHDTIRTHKTDTLREVSYQVRVDTVRQTETHTITLNNVGDTIKEIHHYHDSEKVIVVDSTDRYKAVVDSLRAALVSEQQKTKEVVKTRSVVRWWEWLLIVAIVAGLAYGAKMIKE
jgi:hypothetical protein